MISCGAAIISVGWFSIDFDKYEAKILVVDSNLSSGLFNTTELTRCFHSLGFPSRFSGDSVIDSTINTVGYSVV